MTISTITFTRLSQFREEVHFECVGEFHRRVEGEGDVLVEDLGDVGAGDLHAARELGLVDAEGFHALQDLAQESGCHPVNRTHLGVFVSHC